MIPASRWKLAALKYMVTLVPETENPLICKVFDTKRPTCGREALQFARGVRTTVRQVCELLRTVGATFTLILNCPFELVVALAMLFPEGHCNSTVASVKNVFRLMTMQYT